MLSYIFTVVMLSRSKMEALLEQSNLDFFKVCIYHLSTFIAQWNLLISLENHLIIKAYMHIRYLIGNNYFDLHIPNLVALISLSRKERFPFIITFELY